MRADGREHRVSGGQAIALRLSGGGATFQSDRSAHVVIRSGAEIREALLADGPFIMNEQCKVEAAVARYRAGGMGYSFRSVESGDYSDVQGPNCCARVCHIDCGRFHPEKVSG